MKAIIRSIHPTTGETRYTESDDPRMDAAISQIYNDYGDEVYLKSKPLRKFGKTENADSGVKTAVQTLQGTEVLETYATGNTIDRIVSTSGSDTGTVQVEGRTYSADADGAGNPGLVFAAQEATLEGQTIVTLGTPLVRCNRIFFKQNGGTLASPQHELKAVGTISVYDSTVATSAPSGVPSDATATKAIIQAGQAQTEKCATAISWRDYYILTRAKLSGLRGNSATAAAEGDIEVSTNGAPFRPIGLELSVRSGGDQNEIVEFNPYIVVPKNSDIRIVVEANAADLKVSGYFSGVLAVVRGTD
jgi:hypothetical protein